jgi:serine protease DegQ
VAAAPAPAATPNPAGTTARRWTASSPRVLWAAIATLALLLVLSIALSLRPGQRRITQDDINAAVLKTLETTVLPSPAAKAYENIRPSPGAAAVEVSSRRAA